MTDVLGVRAQLEGSAGPVLFSDLVAHLRRGGVFLVEPAAVLLDAAVAIAEDDTETVTRLVTNGCLRRPTDEEQQAWATAVGRTWSAIVVQPFVLIADPVDEAAPAA